MHKATTRPKALDQVQQHKASRLTMRRVLSGVVLLGAISFWGSTVRAGASYTVAANEQALLNNPSYEVWRVTVLKSTPKQGTNGNPPKVTLKLNEVMRGAKKKTPQIALWLSRPHSVDWAGPGAAKARKKWASRPLPGPGKGQKLIVLLQRFGKQWGVVHRCRYRDTPAKRKWVRKILQRWKQKQKRAAKTRQERSTKSAPEKP